MDFPLGHVYSDRVTDVTDRAMCDGKAGLPPHAHEFYWTGSLRPTTSHGELRAACGNSGNVEDNKSLY
jgi:hypothetical protein